MSLRSGKSGNRTSYDSVDYTKLIGRDNEFVDVQFARPPPKVPWKALTLAALLLVAGVVLLTLGILVVTGHLNTTYTDRMWPMIILGILMFIPGAYHIRIAYYAFRQVPGYSFDDIPEFEWDPRKILLWLGTCFVLSKAVSGFPRL